MEGRSTYGGGGGGVRGDKCEIRRRGHRLQSI